ncbi:DUF4159 domain-containing protein [Denitrobaculum tricleocarpae]|uniref:DUF4159 domain-containing protein n=1 Tax=Denitrobaculum tricleocarpae TaxID=2591009 RepID=A0A545U226_9PROT|nr:DUF4159 domain-containing protein [Denitrobaculum tricleocarpae]TQV83532.1 DUF4159 domain-containing protein [Denitrobaculum tricleocarpae]
MLDLGLMAFTQPWLLAALIGLPLIWLLLRVTPPSPKTLSFPAVQLLLGLEPPEETPARTPLWLILLRMLIILLIILGLAQPLINPAALLPGSGPVVVVIDNGWASAKNWDSKMEAMLEVIERAEREERPVVLLPTAAATSERHTNVTALLPAAEALELAQGIQPHPWPVERMSALESLQNLDLGTSAHVAWLSDGIADAESEDFGRALRGIGRVTVLRDQSGSLAKLVRPPQDDGLDLVIPVERSASGGSETVTVSALAEDGTVVAREPVTFEAGEQRGELRLQLPTELRNRVAQLSLENESTAGARYLLDESSRRRPVGLVTTGGAQQSQPLLSEVYYLQRALEPYSEVRQGSIDELLTRQLAVLALPDIGNLTPEEEDRLSGWVENGGLLLRFAGPRMAAESDDVLLPVRLRGGDRILGGALTWDSPASLAGFAEGTPFAGLDTTGDVTVERQVLAEPSLELGEKTWARLSDGTPLITAEQRETGWVILFHTTANTDWSNLALSGLFVDMLRRIVAVSQGVSDGNANSIPLPPLEVMNGFGRLVAPSASVKPLPAAGEGDASASEADASSNLVSAERPPGFYGEDVKQRVAHNLVRQLPPLEALGPVTGAESGSYSKSEEIDLQPWLLLAALLLALADLLLSLFMRGLVRPQLSQAAAALVVALGTSFIALNAGEAGAQSQIDEVRALEATLETRLAFVITGTERIDAISEAGLQGLTRILRRRTSVEAGAPLGVNIERDELAFFPLLYWPITAEQRTPSAEATRRLNDYLNNGGTILFDLRDPSATARIQGQQSQTNLALQRLTANVAIPTLEPVPTEHVLRKSFYLMQEFPGRYAGGNLWIETNDSQTNDGVARVIVGSNDWAGAWATTELGRPILPVVPGKEAQREMAYRFGVNLVMYALTGNYKADQVHIPFILERLGQ